MSDPSILSPVRRAAMLRGARAALLCVAGPPALARQQAASNTPPDARWHAAALSMKRLAESTGDQPYGAVLVRNNALLGEAPSRVVVRNDPAAHAEREAIADAQRRYGAKAVEGGVLYSTSRPCRDCEAAAAAAGVARMVFGAELHDAGRPRP